MGEGLTGKFAEKDVQEALDNFDDKLHERRVVWGLNAPNCLCESCYENWLEVGRELYKDQPEVYGKIVGEEEAHREVMRAVRRHPIQYSKPEIVFD